jgi:hypothetical protein
MDIQHALVADYAEIVNGKLYLMGGAWDTYHAREVPATVRMAIAVGLRVDWEETNQAIPVMVHVEDDDGRELARIEGKVQVGRPASLPPGSRQLSQMAVNLGFTLPAYGGYRVRVVAGTGEAAKESLAPFRVAPRV